MSVNTDLYHNLDDNYYVCTMRIIGKDNKKCLYTTLFVALKRLYLCHKCNYGYLYAKFRLFTGDIPRFTPTYAGLLIFLNSQYGFLQSAYTPPLLSDSLSYSIF